MWRPGWFGSNLVISPPPNITYKPKAVGASRTHDFGKK
jgi:hypothetical protein